jgi:hypothetical protein
MTKDFWDGYVPEPTIKKSLTVEATLKLALKALEEYSEQEGFARTADQAITAIKQALAAPVQPNIKSYLEKDNSQPVKWSDYEPDGMRHNKPSAAQRQWVGLTDEERTMCRSYDPDEAVAKTEAKLKERNNG